MDEHNKLSNFIKKLDPNNPDIPDDFDPTVTVFDSENVNKQVRETGRPTDEYLCQKINLNELAPMNFWIMYHPGFRVPDKLMYPVDLFRSGIGIESPLSTWIVYNKTGDIPEYLLDYLEVDREKTRYVSCLMTWIEFRTDEIPDVLLKELNFRLSYTGEFTEWYEVNAAGALMFYRDTGGPLHPDFLHLLDDCIPNDKWLSNVVKFWLRCHKDEPVPDKFLDAIENRIGTFDYEYEGVECTLLWQYRYHRPDEKIPNFLYRERPFRECLEYSFELVSDKLDQWGNIYLLDKLIAVAEEMTY